MELAYQKTVVNDEVRLPASADIKPDLDKCADSADELRTNAEWLGIDLGQLANDLEKIAKTAATPTRIKNETRDAANAFRRLEEGAWALYERLGDLTVDLQGCAEDLDGEAS
jgi:hypothetical protein